jgi:hypothetical protein
MNEDFSALSMYVIVFTAGYLYRSGDFLLEERVATSSTATYISEAFVKICLRVLIPFSRPKFNQMLSLQILPVHYFYFGASQPYLPCIGEGEYVS